MLKKYMFVLMAALILVTTSVGIAFADEGVAPDRQQNKDKKVIPVLVIRIGADQFAVQGKNGELTVLVNESTVFKNRDGEELSFSNLVVDGYVVIRGGRDDAGNLLAKLVIILPEDFSPQERNLAQLKGKVVKVRLLQRSFDLLLESGETVTINIDGQTRFAGAVSQLSDLKPDLVVGVAALRKDDGTILAKAVIARRDTGERPDAKRVAGKVIDSGNHFLSIETRDGRLGFIINGDTVIKGPQGRDINLRDIEVGSSVMVVYKTGENGNLLAVHISVKKSQTERPQVRKANGEVTAISGSQLSIVNAEGSALSFEITDETRFVSRDGSVGQASDIQVGQKVLVVYSESEDGGFVAKIIGAGKSPRH